MTMNPCRTWQTVMLGVLGVCSLSARADLVKSVEPLGGAGVVRIGTYLDDNIRYSVVPPTSVSLYGTAYNLLSISSNGTIVYGNSTYFSTNPSNLPLPMNVASRPGLWVCQDDWIQPEFGATPGGYMYYKQYPDGLAITWVNVRQAPVTLGAFTNTFQAFLYTNGDIAFGYGQMNRTELYVAGINKGTLSQYSSFTGVNVGQTAFGETGVPPTINLRTYLFRYDGTNYQPSRAYTLSGTITLQSLVATAPTQTITLTFQPTDNSGSFSRTVSVDSTGAFSVPVLPAKTYNVRVKGAKWLAKLKALDTTAGNITAWNTTLLSGDANDDNAVDIGDLLPLIAKYNTVQNVNPGYSEAVDFNGDGAIDIGDLLLLIGNYNQLGQ